MDKARQFPIPVHGLRGLLESADQHHLAVQLEQIHPVQPTRGGIA